MSKKRDRLNDAARIGSLEMVNWLMFVCPDEYRQKADQETLNMAAYSGNMELFKWLLCVCRQEEKQVPNQDTFDMAARSGNVQILIWLWDSVVVGPRFKVTQKTLIMAARSGDIDCANWVLSQNTKLVVGKKVWVAACESGNIKLLDELKEKQGRKLGLHADKGMMYAAIDSGNFGCVKWVQAHGEKNLDGSVDC